MTNFTLLLPISFLHVFLLDRLKFGPEKQKSSFYAKGG